MDHLHFLSLLTIGKPKIKDVSQSQEMMHFHSVFQELNFPKLSEKHVEEIRNQIKEGNDINQIIHKFVKEIDFNEKLTQHCYNSLAKTQNLSKEEASYYLLHSIFSWLFFSRPQIKQDTCNIILNSAAALKGQIPDEEETSLYKYVINHVSDLYSDTKIDSIIDSMVLFFKKPGPADSKIFDILFTFFNKLKMNDSQNLESQADKLLLLMSLIFVQSPNLLTNNVYDNLFLKLQPHILNFNHRVFYFFHTILPYARVDSIYTFFVTIFKEYEKKIEANQPFFTIEKSDRQAFSVQLPPAPQLAFRPMPLQLSSEPTIHFEDIPLIEDITNERFENIANPIIEVATAKEYQMIFEQHVVTLIQSKLQSEFLFDHVYVLSKIFLSFESSEILLKIVDMFLHTGIFDPSITIFNSNLTSYETNCISIRSIIYKLIFKNIKSSLSFFLSLFLPFPRMISELFVFMIRNAREISPASIDNHVINLQNITMNYSTLLDEKNSKNSLVIKELMELLVLFLSNLLDRKDMADHLCSSESFTTMMVWFIFLPFSRHTVIETFKKVILTHQITIPAQSIHHIAIMFKLSKSGGTEFDYSLIYDLTVLINSIVSKRKDFSELIEQLPEIFLFILYHLKQFDVSEKLLDEIIKFYRLYTIKFDYNQSLSFVHAIKILYGDEPPQHLYSELVSIIIEDDTMIITQPYIPVLILLAFSNSSRNVESLQFIHELCKFSQSNSVLIHNGRLDISLLELINQKKASVDESEQLYIIEGLKLIEKICHTISSTAVAKKFIGLLCPIDEKFISKYHTYFLDSLISIINQEASNPTDAMPLSKSSFFIQASDLKPSWFQKGFEVTFWLFADYLSNATLFSISTKEKHEINISIKNNMLKLRTNKSKEITNSFSFDVNIPVLKWFYVSFNISKKNDKIVVNGYFNDTKLQPFVGPWNSWQFTTIDIGRNECDTGSKLSSFGLFTIPNNKSLYSEGHKAIHSNALLYIKNEIVNERLIPRDTSSNNIPIEFIGPPVIQHVTFIDTLIRICTVEALLPLYAQLDFPYIDNTETPPSLPMKITEIFSSLLSIGQEVEEEFVKSKIFNIIEFLLTSLNRNDFLTFDFYLTFYKIFLNIRTRELRSQLFVHILMSFSLWSNAVAKETERIVDHWQTTLYEQFMPESVRLFSMEKLLYLMNDYFPYSGNFHITSIRASLIKIMYYISTTSGFKQDDISALIGESLILGSDIKPPPNKITDLLKLLHDLAKSPSKPLEKFPSIWKKITKLHNLLNVKNDILQLYIWHLLLDLHETPIFSFLTIEQHMDAMLPFFSTMFSSTFYNQIMGQIASNNSGFVPLAFYIAYTNPKIHEMIMMHLKPRKELTSSVEYLFWLFACIYKYDNDFGKFIVKLIIDCNIISIKLTMIIIDVVGLILGKHDDSKSVKIRFLSNYMGKSGPKDDEFFEVAFQSLLFKKAGNFSKLLKSELINTYGIVFSKNENIDLINRLNGAQSLLHNYLQSVKNQEFKLIFGIELDGSSDQPSFNNNLFVQSLISMIVMNKKDEYYNAASILAYFNCDTDKFNFFLRSPSLSPEINKRLSNATNETKQTVDSNTWHSVLSKEFMKINEDYCESITRYLKSFCKVFEEIDINTKKLFSPTTENIISNVRQRINDLQQDQETHRHEIMKTWFHLWNRLSFDRAFWADARTEKTEKHYKRNMFLCWNQYPSKLKLNYNFDDHRLASLAQETGNFNTAKQILDEEKERLKLTDSRDASRHASFFLMPSDHDLEANNIRSKSFPDTLSDAKIGNQGLIYSYNAIYYKLEKEKSIQFDIYTNKIVLEFQDYRNSIILEASNILSILMRGILHQPRGLEIFMKNGPAYLIIFDKSEKNVFEILRSISLLRGFNNVTVQTLPHQKFFKTLGIKEKWESGHLSNFEYLLSLNCYSGRSFNDPAMYPVFPWILSDYHSDSIDLKNPASFRDLSKPIGALNPERLDKLKNRQIPSDTIVTEPYMYPSSYSSLLYVYLFLIRMEPFTSLHIKAQNGKFDHGPRQFSSIPKAYDLVTENIQDFRELIPEFFFESSFLQNVNNFNIGKFEGNQIGDVELPPWAEKNSLKFIYMNRKALESQYVSQHLNEWIDLIWGVKQNGPKAVEANNTFIPYMYESIWANELISNPSKAQGAEAILQTCGQIPIQLFTTEHAIKKEPEFPVLFAKSKEVLDLTFKDLSYSCLSATFPNKAILTAVDTSGNIYSIIVKFVENQQPPYLVVEKQWKSSFGEWDPKLITVIDSTTIAAGSSLGKIEIINERSSNPIIFQRHLGKITCVTADSRYLVTGGNDTATNIFLSNNSYINETTFANNTILPTFSSSPEINFYHFFPTYRDDVTCCAVNSNFDLIVSGTRDSSLFFFSPLHKTVTKIVDLSGRIPEKVLITDGWGFVVVYELSFEKGVQDQCIEVYDVNGEFITSKPLQFAIQQWTSYKSVDGFDYLLILSIRGIFYSCEVFYLDLIKPITEKLNVETTSLSYSYDLGIVFVGLCKGTIQMIKYRPT